MNKQRRKDIEGAMESADEAKALLNENSKVAGEIATDLRGGESEGIRTRLMNLKTIFETASGKLDDAKSVIEQAKDEEQDYYDNMPENMQWGDKGSTAEQAVSDLESCESDLGEAQDTVDGMVSTLEEMIGDETRNEWEESDANSLDEFEDKIGEIETSVESAQSNADSAANG